jgi:pyruvate/2-oxoglutarate dehydrogenase complex dihydrolipoamide acyltransferase (E2) component/uncharacterized OsmC-like protein
LSLEASAIPSTPILMPKIGQAMAEGTVIQWHCQEGERVEMDQVLVTIETDKATYDLEAPTSGTLHIYVGEEQEVPIGTVIGEIGDVSQRPREPVSVAPPAASTAVTSTARASKKILASPKAKQLAAQHSIDVSTVAPSGADGVISAADVEKAIAAGGTGTAAVTGQVVGRSLREQRRLTGIRRTSARRVLDAWQSIPHIVQMVDVDATNLFTTRTQLRSEAPSIALNDLVLHAAARVMAENPDLNGTVAEETLVLYEGVDVGFAVDTPRGLVVPVIRRADKLSAVELAAESQRLIEAARSGRLAPEDMGSASLTVSNLGMFGIRAGTPVINLGEPLLVFVGAVEDRPTVVQGQVVVRPLLTLSIAYDHRVADGVAAARFTRGLKESLESRVQSLESRVRDTSPQPLTPGPQEELGRREVRAVSEGDGYVVQVRNHGHAWVLDEPVVDGGADAGPDPVSAFLGALLSCLTIAFKAAARRRQVKVEQVEGRVKATPEGRINAVAMTLEVWSPDPEEKVRTLLEPAKRSCFVSNILKPDLDYKLDLSVHTTKTKP